MLPGMEMLACPNLAVSREVMQHVVQVESGANPFAIGVVNGQLVRQPKSMDEALATVQMLENKGYNFSVGIAQVNRSNLGRYGLDSYRKAFTVCDNLTAGAQILSRCYTSAGSDWGKAFSCYYSGNFTTGFRDGYVQKVYASIAREAAKKEPVVEDPAISSTAIPLVSQAPELAAASGANALKPVTVYAADSSQYRVALRSVAIDTATAALMPLVISAAGLTPHADTSSSIAVAPAETAAELLGHAGPNASAAPDAKNQTASAQRKPEIMAEQAGSGVFEPQVRGPNDVTPAKAAFAQGSTKPASDLSDLRQEHRDASFVF